MAAEFALSRHELEAAIPKAEADATAKKVCGPALTPYLLSRLAELTNGRSLRTNQALVLANARLAAEIACALVSGAALSRR